MTRPDKHHLDGLSDLTLAVHAGNRVDPGSGALRTPLVMANSYALGDDPSQISWSSTDGGLYTRNTGVNQLAIPAEYARTHFAPPGQKEAMVIATARGASATVADQVALALDPRHPEAYQVVPPPAATVVRDRVNTSTQTLFYALAGIGVLVSGVGIANVSLIGVIARSREIALRRSLGALPRHIAVQFLLESAVRGLGKEDAVSVCGTVRTAFNWRPDVNSSDEFPS